MDTLKDFIAGISFVAGILLVIGIITFTVGYFWGEPAGECAFGLSIAVTLASPVILMIGSAIRD